MIKAKNLSRSYGGVKAVDCLNFEVPEHQVVGLLGHNGAGKTTTLKMLTGYLEPSKGHVNIDGIDVQRNPLKARSLMGYLPEQSPLYPEMTVVEYLDYVAKLRGIQAEQRARLIEDAIKATDLGERAFQLISTLSKGFKQRVGVAQAILHKPKLVILDEPTSGLDPSQIITMRKLIKKLSQESTVIISTHIMQEVEAMCDRVIIIRQGRIAIDSQLNNLKKTNYINLSIDKPIDKLKPLCKDLAEIQKIEETKQDGNSFSYKIYSSSPATDELSSKIAKKICLENWNLYSITPQQRTLETIFKEVNTRSIGGATYV